MWGGFSNPPGRTESPSHIEARVEDDSRSRRLRLRQEPAIERSLLRAAPDEPAVRRRAANDARHAVMVVERGPISGTKIEVALDADAIEKLRHRLRFGGAFDDLQIADEAHPHVALGLVDLHAAPGARQNDGRCETGR